MTNTSDDWRSEHDAFFQSKINRNHSKAETARRILCWGTVPIVRRPPRPRNFPQGDRIHLLLSPPVFFFFPLFSPRKKGNLRRPQLRTLQTCTERNKPRNLNDDRIRPRPNARLGSDIWPVTAMTSRKIGPYISSPLSDRSDDAECIFAFVLSACGITTFRDISRVKEGCPFFSPRWEGGCLCACSHSATGKSLLTRQSCMRNYSDISAGAKRAIIACSST